MLKIELYGPGSNTDVTIAFDPLPPDKVTVGAVVYPEPEFVILIDVIEPPLMVAVAVATVPLGGGEMITFGAVVYPVPPELIITLSTEEGPDPLPKGFYYCISSQYCLSIHQGFPYCLFNQVSCLEGYAFFA